MSHRVLYLIVGGVMTLLLVVMLITYNYNKNSEEALAKAEQLSTALEEAGLPAPTDPANVARVLGNDGGAVCASVQDGVALGIMKLNLSVGGAFYTRAVIADQRLATALLIIVETYCPDKVSTAQEFLDSQNFDTVVPN